MKQVILILLISIVLGCNDQKNELNSTSIQQYEYNGPDGLVDTLELHYKNDSLIGGLYRGVYKDNNKTLFYYSSPFENSNSNSQYDIVFSLDSLKINKDGISFLNESDSNHKQVNATLPLFFSHSISFLGTFSGNELKITRTSGLNIFSSADDRVFKRIVLK